MKQTIRAAASLRPLRLETLALGVLLAAMALSPGRAAAQNCPAGAIDNSQTLNANGYTATSVNCTTTGTIGSPVTVNLSNAGGASYNQLIFTNQAGISTSTPGFSALNLFTSGIPINANNYAYGTDNYLTAPPITVLNQGSITLGSAAGTSVAALLAVSTGAPGYADGNTTDGSTAPNNHYMGRNGGAVSVENSGTITTNASGNFYNLTFGGIQTPANAGINASSIGGAGVADKHGQGPGGNAGNVTVTTDQGSAITATGTDTGAIMAVSAGGAGSGYSQDATHNYDSGGNAGSVTVTHSGAITGSNTGGIGIFALSAGGSSGATDNQYSLLGGNAGGVTVNLQSPSTITMSGDNSIGVFAVSAGGLSWYAEGNDSNGHNQNGNGGSVNVTMASGASITTSGELGAGIVAASTGGNANTSEAPPDSEENGGSPNAVPTTRAPAGNAGNVTVTSTGAIGTQGDVAIGIAAVSATGGTVIHQITSSNSIDQVGEGSGTPGTVTVTQNSGGSISTTGAGAIGMLGLSIGGPGGVLDTRAGLLNLLGDNTANPGISGNTVSLTNNGTVSTQGAAAIGLLAESIGGGGGTATGTGGIFAIGSNGGTGGNGGTVNVTNNGAITTAGNSAPGILAHSIGGGGGNGGTATGLAVAVGGSGGAAGDGGSISFNIDGAISTAGLFSPGAVAQSIGGGGGNGGATTTISLLPFSAAIGGSGSAGGNGGDLDINVGATISTTGQHAHGLLAQSVGGGGGTGGSANSYGIAEAVSITLAIGGSGGAGGDGGNVTVDNGYHISTGGADSLGILAQSVGGGGGDGGAATAYSLAIGGDPEVPSISLSAAVGGAGGGGGNGGAVNVSNIGIITTSGAGAIGVLAQSIGGGGGNGGDSTAQAHAIEAESPTFKASVSIGGGAGAGGNGGSVTVSSTSCNGCESLIQTSGNSATGILAQSVGGGGGNGGAGDAETGSPNLGGTTGTAIGITYGMGGTGGASGTGGTVSVTLGSGAQIVTTGSGSQGILAQSVGGGGGNGGGGSASGSGDLIDVNVAVGGNAGSGSNGGTVTVSNAGTISTGSTTNQNGQSFTTGGDAVGILAQSIGGGGGTGGSSDPAATIGTADQIEDAINAPSASYTAQIGVGGKGGSGNNGGTVSVTNTGTIQTLGARAYGILAQSVGGGGGWGGAADASANSVLGGPGQKVSDTGEVSTVGDTYAAAITVGGQGGAAGSGGSLTVVNTGGSILTAGYGAVGILAQSIGGGGGVGGEGTVNNTTTIGLGGGFGGGSGGGGGGGTVSVNSGAITTLGDDADAVLAQSIGGGGGAASAGCSNSAVPSGAGQGINASSCFGNTQKAGVNGAIAPWNDASDFSFTVGGATGVSGDGGTVNVTVDGAIVTQGARAIGVVAQSIGSGGGFVTGAATNIGGTGVGNAAGQNSAKGGDVSVTLNAGASIATSGAGAWGILAQSIGGGGGLAGDPSLAMPFPVSNTLPNVVNNAYPDSGTVNVTVGGNITTSGANAHGIFAQAIGGGGGIVAGCCNSATAELLAGNTAQFRSLSGASYAGEGFGVTIDQTGGTISTSGAGSIGIIAQSSGKYVYTQPINITIGGTVIGGTNSGVTEGVGAAGILVTGGVLPNTDAPQSANMITVNAGGSVSTMDGVKGTAIIAGDGVTDVSNSGTITGSINLDYQNDAPGSGPGTIINNSGGVLNPGSTLTASTLTNNGTINLPGFKVNLIGNFVQNSDGILTVPYAPAAASQLAVSGSAALGGTITPVVGTSFLPGTQTLLTASSLAVSASVTHPLLYTWNLETPSNTVTLSPVSNFTPSGVPMNADAAAIANYLTSAWNNADPKLGNVFGTLYNKVQTGTTYTSLLGQLSPSATQVPVTALTNLSGMILGSAMSCPQFEDGTTRLGEGSCVWAKGNGQVTNEYGLGGSVTSSGYHIGGQGALGPNWRIGGAFGGGSIWATEGNGSKGSGQSYDGSVALKYTNGPWLFAGSLALANAAYSHNRVIDVPGVASAVLQSNSEALLFGGRLRAAYTFGFNGWYVRPLGDLDLFYTHTPAFTESGGSTYALAVNATSKVNVAITPAVEIGSRFDLNPVTTMRAYAVIGMSVLPDNQRSVASRFASASLDDGTFATTIKSPEVTGNLDLGVQIYHVSGFDLRADYNLRGGDAFLSQGGTLRLGYRF